MTATKKKIAVFSGKRGGLGAYAPLMRLIEDDAGFELHIILGDMHTSAEFGGTAKEAKALFPRAAIHLIRMGAGRGDTPRIRAENLGVCMREGARILARIVPDMLMVHGDRGEHLAAALAGIHLNIPITHSQGGDISGNIDEIIRHSITKLAHIHFPETKQAAQRIARLGEEPWRIHTAGSLYIDRIVKKMYPPVVGIKKTYGIADWREYAIVLFHPETFRSREENYQTAKNIFTALDAENMPALVIYPCSDPGYEGIIAAIREREKDRDFIVYKNIPHLDFLSLMSEARLLIGNSSAGIKEAPYFQMPAINIGGREQGRERESNVVDCGRNTSGIRAAIRFAADNAAFRKGLRACGYHLGDGHASERILAVLKKIKKDDRLMQKRITY